MEITYTMQGDYLLPNLTLPEQEKKEIGIWGQRHRRYLQNHHKVRYYNLLTSCKLTDYLADINEQAENMYQLLVKQLAKKEVVTEQLKYVYCNIRIQCRCRTVFVIILSAVLI